MTDNDVLRDLREYRSNLNAITYPTLSQLLASAADEIERLLQFVDDQHCDCFDEYNQPRPNVCDRCKLLRLDPRILGG